MMSSSGKWATVMALLAVAAAHGMGCSTGHRVAPRPAASGSPLREAVESGELEALMNANMQPGSPYRLREAEFESRSAGPGDAEVERYCDTQVAESAVSHPLPPTVHLGRSQCRGGLCRIEVTLSSHSRMATVRRAMQIAPLLIPSKRFTAHLANDKIVVFSEPDAKGGSERTVGDGSD